MNRRKFFEFIGKALGAVAIAPMLPPVEIEQSELEEDPRSPEPKHWKWDGLGNVWKSDNGKDWEQVARAELWDGSVWSAGKNLDDYAFLKGLDTPEPLGVINNAEATITDDMVIDDVINFEKTLDDYGQALAASAAKAESTAEILHSPWIEMSNFTEIKG